jgi:hypothetical protein
MNLLYNFSNVTIALVMIEMYTATLKRMKDKQEGRRMYSNGKSTGDWCIHFHPITTPSLGFSSAVVRWLFVRTSHKQDTCYQKVRGNLEHLTYGMEATRPHYVVTPLSLTRDHTYITVETVIYTYKVGPENQEYEETCE